jgi:hypothetical protein
MYPNKELVLQNTECTASSAKQQKRELKSREDILCWTEKIHVTLRQGNYTRSRTYVENQHASAYQMFAKSLEMINYKLG